LSVTSQGMRHLNNTTHSAKCLHIGLTSAEIVYMVMQDHDLVRDPYRRCEERCRHDLGRGLSLAELLGPEDAPLRPAWAASLPPAPRRLPLYASNQQPPPVH